MNTVGCVLTWGRRTLQAVDSVGAAIDARVLLRHVTGLDDVQIVVNKERLVGESDYERYRQLVLERCNRRTPIAYLTGQVQFYGLDLKVNPGVFIPRPETEHVVEAVLSAIAAIPAAVVVDIGTGSGAIAVSVAVGQADATVVAIDKSTPACSCARANAERMNVSDRVTVIQGSILKPLAGCPRAVPDVVVSNPPYVKTIDLAILPVDVRDHEPISALDGGSDGLEMYTMVITETGRLCPQGTMLVLELGAGQADDVRALALGTGKYRFCRLIRDYAGIERVLVLQIK